jgi:hypothetical protein
MKYFVSPIGSFLSLDNGFPDVPIQEQQFLIHCYRCPDLSSADFVFDFQQQLLVRKIGRVQFHFCVVLCEKRRWSRRQI